MVGREQVPEDGDNSIEAGVHERSRLRPGDRVEGPAIIVERETATIVASPFDATVLNDGCLRVARRPAKETRP